jgi:hypothetical protein
MRQAYIGKPPGPEPTGKLLEATGSNSVPCANAGARSLFANCTALQSSTSTGGVVKRDEKNGSVVGVKEAANLVEEQRKSRPDHPVTECIPTSGVFAKYLEHARLAAPNSADIYHVGAAIPTLLNELNLRNFQVEGVGAPGQPKPLSVFSLLLGPSGDGKSTGATTAIHHICEILESEEEVNTNVAARARRLEFEGTAEGLRHALTTKFFQRDLRSTIALVYHEELTALFNNARANTAEFLQRLYDGRDIVAQQRQFQKQLDQEGVDNSAILAPRINAIFCSTPDNLSAVLSRTMASGGLYGRLLIFVGEKREASYPGDLFGHRNRCEGARLASEQEIGAWSAFLDACAVNGKREVTISKEAHEVFRTWFFEHHSAVENADDNLKSMIARATRTEWTIAGLYATTQFRTSISADDAERACKLVDRCFHMGKLLDRRLGQTEDSKVQDAILAGVVASGKKGITQSEVHHLSGVANKGLVGAQIRAYLETLAEAGSIVCVTEQRSGPGRRTSRYYTTDVARKLKLVADTAN